MTVVVESLLLACYITRRCRANESQRTGKQSWKQCELVSRKREETPASWWRRNKKRHRLSEAVIPVAPIKIK